MRIVDCIDYYPYGLIPPIGELLGGGPLPLWWISGPSGL